MTSQICSVRTAYGLESDAAGLAALRHLSSTCVRCAVPSSFARHLTAVGETVAPDFRFHLAIAQATGNRYFSDLMGQLGWR
jgi:DNA-binding FadR family transcriptional regulator